MGNTGIGLGESNCLHPPWPIKKGPKKTMKMKM